MLCWQPCSRGCKSWSGFFVLRCSLCRDRAGLLWLLMSRLERRSVLTSQWSCWTRKQPFYAHKRYSSGKVSTLCSDCCAAMQPFSSRLLSPTQSAGCLSLQGWEAYRNCGCGCLCSGWARTRLLQPSWHRKWHRRSTGLLGVQRGHRDGRWAWQWLGIGAMPLCLCSLHRLLDLAWLPHKSTEYKPSLIW